jgi:hypothetical protein
MPDVYEQARLHLDSAWGYPNEATRTVTAIPPASDLPMDSQGMVYLDVSSEYCEYVLPSQMLPQLLASSAVEEIDAATYLQEVPQIPVQ